MTKTFRAACFAAAIFAVACTDSKPEQASVSDTADTAAGAVADTARIDSTAGIPSSPARPDTQRNIDALPPGRPNVIGETRDEPPRSRDPMPPLRGETSKGETMPVYRDSVSGPRMEIDSKGRIVPIKK